MNIIVKKQGVIVSKDVFCGDDVKSRELIQSLKNKNPDLTYEEVDLPSFDAAVLVPVVDKEQTDWSSLKTADDRIAFIAKKMGLQ